jgi:hypothetical protein
VFMILLVCGVDGRMLLGGRMLWSTRWYFVGCCFSSMASIKPESDDICGLVTFHRTVQPAFGRRHASRTAGCYITSSTDGMCTYGCVPVTC